MQPTTFVSGRKFDAAKLSEEMRTEQQIIGFWSRYAAMKRANAVSAEQQATTGDILSIPIDEYHRDPNVPSEEYDIHATTDDCVDVETQETSDANRQPQIYMQKRQIDDVKNTSFQQAFN